MSISYIFYDIDIIILFAIAFAAITTYRGNHNRQLLPVRISKEQRREK